MGMKLDSLPPEDRRVLVDSFAVLLTQASMTWALCMQYGSQEQIFECLWRDASDQVHEVSQHLCEITQGGSFIPVELQRFIATPRRPDTPHPEAKEKVPEYVPEVEVEHMSEQEIAEAIRDTEIFCYITQDEISRKILMARSFLHCVDNIQKSIHHEKSQLNLFYPILNKLREVEKKHQGRETLAPCGERCEEEIVTEQQMTDTTGATEQEQQMADTTGATEPGKIRLYTKQTQQNLSYTIKNYCWKTFYDMTTSSMDTTVDTYPGKI